MNQPRLQQGLSLIEVVIYVAILGLILVLVFDTVLSVGRAVTVVRMEKKIVTSGTLALERISREVRDSTSIITASSTFNVNPGTLATYREDPVGTFTPVFFDRTNKDRLRITKGATADFLTPSNVRVSKLIFRYSSTTNSEAVKIEFELSATTSATTTFKFYNTIVLRETYQ